MASGRPLRIAPEFHEKIWGSSLLEPWFPNSDRKIGEAWFSEENSPLLVKFLFTTDYLSVQVHPNDEQARQLELPGCCGKTEMWHILRAGAEAKLALGLERPFPAAELRRAAETGAIMDMLRWVPAVAGQTWFVPAGTIHAIGADITLCEIQQNSDVTYRLYDYNRGRELHLEKGIAVANPGVKPELAGDEVLCPYFHTRIMVVKGEAQVASGMMAVVEGGGEIDGEPFHAGEVWRLPGDCIIRSGHTRVVVIS